MNGFEFNKIFGAILLALLVAMLANFVSREMVSPEPLARNAYVVEGVNKAATEAPAAAADKGPASIAPMMVSANIEAGQKYARVCSACHNFEKGGPNKVGPNLYNIVNNKHAHMDNFAYSDMMKSMESKKWTYEELNQFLYNPRSYAPGTKMAFAGIKSDAERANVIAWLRSLADTPAAMP